MDRNITGVEWEAETEIQMPATHIPQINNNEYEALADEEENEGNDNKSTGEDNDGKITGVRHDDELSGVDSNKRARNQEAQDQLTKRTNWHSLRRLSQKQNEILRKQLIY